MSTMTDFERDIAYVINRHSRENVSNTPDFVLARHMVAALEAFEATTAAREPSKASGPDCPGCGAEEVEADTPLTTYACGSKDYDQRPGTFRGPCA